MNDNEKFAEMMSMTTCTDGTPCIPMNRLYPHSPAPVPVTTPPSTSLDLVRKLSAEFLGTALLVSIVVGSGITAQTLSPNDIGLQLLENAIATCCGLTGPSPPLLVEAPLRCCVGLILMFGPISGAHFNPVVSIIDFFHEDMALRDVGLYALAQILGGIAGCLVTSLEYDTAIRFSTKSRSQSHLWLGEVVGTASLLLIIHGCLRTGQKEAVPYAVGAWICGGYFFTSSTIFANPAVTIARMFTDSFAGIAPSSVGPFIGFQLLGAGIGFLLIRFFYPRSPEVKKDDNLYMRVCIAPHDHCGV
jgi:glycerol uptake facilitator-like aquaporin